MNIRQVKIEGFKSIRKLELVDLNPFTVFVGANASGKSNIFEAIEFLQLCDVISTSEVVKLFGGYNNFINHESKLDNLRFYFDLDTIQPELELYYEKNLSDGSYESFLQKVKHIDNIYPNRQSKLLQFKNDPTYISFTNFTRLYVGNLSIVKINIKDDERLANDASNLEKVLKRILKNDKNKSEIIELLQLLIPGFSNVEVITEELSGTDNLLIHEKSLKRPISKQLISNGTYNILAIIAAIYQSETPQFLCIEEPENGLNPKVVKELVNLFRSKCEEKGHFIWINTHSQTLVSELQPKEVVLVDKIEGETIVKQINNIDLHGLSMDEALLTNALGGGIPW